MRRERVEDTPANCKVIRGRVASCLQNSLLTLSASRVLELPRRVAAKIGSHDNCAHDSRIAGLSERPLSARMRQSTDGSVRAGSGSKPPVALHRENTSAPDQGDNSRHLTSGVRDGGTARI